MQAHGSLYIEMYQSMHQGRSLLDLYRENSLEMIELSSINKVSLVYLPINR